MERWIVIEIENKTHCAEFIRDIETNEIMYFPSFEDAQKEVEEWNTYGKSYRFINLYAK